MRCLRKLAVGLGDFRFAQMGLSSQTLGKKKRRLRLLILVFSKATQFEKLPPAISLRLFQRDHFVETAPQGACQQDCLLGKSKRGTLSFITHFISSLLLYFCQFDFIYSFKNKVLRSVRISNQQRGHYQISNSL